MKKQSSEGRSSFSAKAKQNNNNSNSSTNIAPNRSNDIYQIPGLKKVSSVPRNQTRSGPIKVLSRELSPVLFAGQKTEPSESQYQSLGGQIQEINKDGSNKPQKTAKNQRAVLNLRSEPDQQISDVRSKKPASALSPKGLADMKTKKTSNLTLNVDAARAVHGKGPKSATNLSNGQFQFFEKNKTEMSEAIFERDEADEEDNKDHYLYKQTPELKVVSADHTMIMGQGMPDSTQLQSQDAPDSPTLFKLNNNDILSFKLENRMMSDPNVSVLKVDFGENPAATKLNANNRGMFMNEHISQTEMEKQKEKKRLMKEALDMQMNEKKRKAEEEKLRQKEENQKEEERIKREMALLKLQHEKEAALEMSKKTNPKNEEFENVLNKPNNIKIALPIKPIEKPEKHSSGSDNLDTRDTSTREEERILRSPAKVQRSTASRNRDLVEPKSPSSPSHKNNNNNPNNMDTLADENKKLRDENTKKEELIEALINALKQKDVGNFQNLQEKGTGYSKSRKEDFNTLKSIETGETESDAYGYTFGGNNPMKLKYRAASEQPSDLHRYDSREPSRPTNEDKNSFFSMVETNKEYQPKMIRPAVPEYLMEFSSQVLSPKDGSYKPGFLKNNDVPFLYGHSSSRVYSSPLANHLSQSSIVSPTTRMDNKSISFMPLISPNSQYRSPGNFTLEPIKSLSQPSAVSPKNGHVPSNMLFNMTGNNNTIVKVKKRYEHSVDFGEMNRENTQEILSPTSFRTGLITEDGAFSLAKLNRLPKREINSSNYSYNFGPAYQKVEMVDTFQYPQEDKNTSNTLETIHESDLNTKFPSKILGKIIFSGNGPHKKMSGGVGKEKWVMNETTLPRTTNQDEFSEKIKALPVLEGKSKFPKDVFSSNIRKKICP